MAFLFCSTLLIDRKKGQKLKKNIIRLNFASGPVNELEQKKMKRRKRAKYVSNLVLILLANKKVWLRYLKR
jgi:hypothetical protein